MSTTAFGSTGDVRATNPYHPSYLPTPPRQPAQANWLSDQMGKLANKIAPPAYAAEKSKSEPSISKPNGNIPDWAWNQVVEGANRSAKKYGIPASLTLAQFLQETGGNPNHFIGGTNVFGIKGSGTAGSVNAPTIEYINGVPTSINANFAKYNNIGESVEAHAKTLMQNPAYSKLQGLIAKGNKDPFALAQSLQGIYATDPSYAKNLQNIMASHGFAHADNYNSYPAQTELAQIKRQSGAELDRKYPQVLGASTGSGATNLNYNKYPGVTAPIPQRDVVSPYHSPIPQSDEVTPTPAPVDIAISRVRKYRPQVKLSDDQLRGYYNQYGEKLVSELPPL